MRYPQFASDNREDSKVSFPTESKTISTPFPLVISNTFSLKFLSLETKVSIHPFNFASSIFSCDPTLPITFTPIAAAHWQSRRPTPPDAAVTKIVFDESTNVIRLISISTVIALRKFVATNSSLKKSGILITLSCDIFMWVA